MKNPAMIVAGVMSGTSADGIDVAMVRLGSAKFDSRRGAEFKLIGHAEYRYPRAVRRAILAAMNAQQASVADLARLNNLLGELYSDAVLAAQRKLKVKADLVGCHGQTLYHQGERLPYLGRRVATTWQTGEAAIVAARVGVPVVSDFRPADLAAGGKGAPLVPFFDYFLFRDPRVGRIVQNIGGIANLTAIPAGARGKDVIAFDTGPGNMVIDALMEKLYGRAFDRDGKVAASGAILRPGMEKVLRTRFFRQPPPKTAGREEFGREFTERFVAACGSAPPEDMVATATALTAASIADAIARHVLGSSGSRRKQGGYRELIVSGGGVRNRTLMRLLGEAVAPLGLRLRTTDELGLPSEAKEASAFALLAYATWQRRPSNIPSATGAKRLAVLGKISYP